MRPRPCDPHVLRVTLACLVAACAVPEVAHAESPGSACIHTLEGRTLDAEVAAPLPSVSVDVRTPAGRVLHVLSDDEGRFAVYDLCPGLHTLSVHRPEYEVTTVEATVPVEPFDVVLAPIGEVIIVESQRLGTESTRASTTLSGATLERTRGKSLADTVKGVSGVTTLQGNTDNAKPVVRGQVGRRLLTLFDGVAHASQKWGLDHAPELDPFAAGSISVLKGAAGVRYGPDAIGGVLLIEPLPLLDAPGLDAEAHVVGGLNPGRGTVAFRLDGAHPKAPGLAWRLEGNLAQRTAVSTPDYVLGNTASRTANVGATLGYDAGPVAVTLSYRRHMNEAGVCYCIQSASADDFFAQLASAEPQGADRWTRDFGIDRPRQAVAHDLVTARIHADVGTAGHLEATYAFQHDHRTEFEQVRGSVDGPQFDFTLRTHSLDVVFDHAPQHFGTAHLTGSAGLSGVFQENVFRGLPLIPNYRAGQVGVFALERVWSQRWEVELGARYDHRSQTAYLTDDAFNRHAARDLLTTDDCALTDSVARCPRSFHAGSVSLGTLVRAVPEALTLKLDLSSASRFPDADELYINGTAPSFPVYGLGDPSLGVETTWSGSLTAHTHAGPLDGEVSGFASYTSNYIYFAPDLGPDGTPAFEVVSRGAFPRFSTRPIDALFYGFDGALSLGAAWPVQLDVNTSSVRAQDVADNSFLVFIPPDRVGGALTYRPPRAPLGAHAHIADSYITVSAQYVARQSRVDPNADLAPAPDPYALLGAAIGTSFHIRGQRVDLALEGTNLLGSRYRDYLSLLRYYADERGRDLTLRASVHVTI